MDGFRVWAASKHYRYIRFFLRQNQGLGVQIPHFLGQIWPLRLKKVKVYQLHQLKQSGLIAYRPNKEGGEGPQKKRIEITRGCVTLWPCHLH
jgi:hypothetical protein